MGIVSWICGLWVELWWRAGCGRSLLEGGGERAVGGVIAIEGRVTKSYQKSYGHSRDGYLAHRAGYYARPDSSIRCAFRAGQLIRVRFPAI